MTEDVYKEISVDGGKIIIKNGVVCELAYGIPDWEDDTEEPCFEYGEDERGLSSPRESNETSESRGDTFFLSEFVRVRNNVWHPNPPEWQLEFNGIMTTSYSSGYLVKLNKEDDDDTVTMYYFYVVSE